jgi:transcriptional regulator with XRE-family HTH domain
MKQAPVNLRENHCDEKLRLELHRYRKHHKLTYRALAARAGVSLTMTWRALRGKAVGELGAGKLRNLILEQK